MATPADRTYALTASQYAQVRADLLGPPGRLGPAAARPDPAGGSAREDTWFDHDGRLHAQGCQLRLRDAGGLLRVTLAEPGGARTGNDGDADLDAALVAIGARLAARGVLDGPPPADPAAVRALRRGVAATVAALGIEPLFTVAVSAAGWVLTGGDAEIGTVRLVESTYRVGTTGELHEYVLVLAVAEAATGLVEWVEARYGPAGDGDAGGFDRGLALYWATTLEEQVEAKITLPGRDDYARVVRLLTGGAPAVGGFRVVPADVRDTFRDVYYDTGDHELARAGWYLRVRRGGEAGDGYRAVTLRALTGRREAGLPVQDQITGRDHEQGFGESWRAVAGRLRRRFGLPFADGAGGDGVPVEDRIGALGLRPALHVELARTSWLVHRLAGDEPGAGLGACVAKLKLDRIRYTRHGAGGDPLDRTEFELTGLSDDDSAGPAEFLAFLYGFVAACDGALGAGAAEVRTGGKYFDGLRALSVLAGDASQPGGELLPVARRPPDPAAALPASRRGAFRLATFVALAAAGIPLLLLALLPAKTSPAGHLADGWRWAAFGGALVLLGSGVTLLLTDHSPVLTRRRRVVLVSGVACLALVAVMIGAGSGVAAEVVSVLGLPVTVVSLLRLGNEES